jgi:hypothetical protein
MIKRLAPYLAFLFGAFLLVYGIFRLMEWSERGNARKEAHEFLSDLTAQRSALESFGIWTSASPILTWRKWRKCFTKPAEFHLGLRIRQELAGFAVARIALFQHLFSFQTTADSAEHDSSRL